MPSSLLFTGEPPASVAVRWVTHDAASEAERRRFLTDEECARLASFRAPDRRRAFLLGRAAARTLLGERLGVDPRAVPLRVEPSGAPAVEAEGLYVSIAHAGDHAAAAVGSVPLGLDLEVIAPRHPELPRFLLHPDERAAWETLPLDPVRRPLLLWTVKEAVLKALQTGLRRSPKTLRTAIDVEAGCADVVVEAAEGQPGGEEAWTVRFAEHAGCYLAVALPPSALSRDHAPEGPRR